MRRHCYANRELVPLGYYFAATLTALVKFNKAYASGSEPRGNTVKYPRGGKSTIPWGF